MNKVPIGFRRVPDGDYSYDDLIVAADIQGLAARLFSEMSQGLIEGPDVDPREGWTAVQQQNEVADMYRFARQWAGVEP